MALHKKADWARCKISIGAHNKIILEEHCGNLKIFFFVLSITLMCFIITCSVGTKVK